MCRQGRTEKKEGGEGEKGLPPLRPLRPPPPPSGSWRCSTWWEPSPRAHRCGSARPTLDGTPSLGHGGRALLGRTEDVLTSLHTCEHPAPERRAVAVPRATPGHHPPTAGLPAGHPPRRHRRLPRSAAGGRAPLRHRLGAGALSAPRHGREGPPVVDRAGRSRHPRPAGSAPATSRTRRSRSAKRSAHRSPSWSASPSGARPGSTPRPGPAGRRLPTCPDWPPSCAVPASCSCRTMACADRIRAALEGVSIQLVTVLPSPGQDARDLLVERGTTAITSRLGQHLGLRWTRPTFRPRSRSCPYEAELSELPGRA